MRSHEEEPFEVLRTLGEQIRVRIGLLAVVGIVCISIGYILAG